MVNLLAGIKSAWLNVLINIGGLDDKAAKDFREKGENIVKIGQEQAEEIQKSII